MEFPQTDLSVHTPILSIRYRHVSFEENCNIKFSTEITDQRKCDTDPVVGIATGTLSSRTSGYVADRTTGEACGRHGGKQQEEEISLQSKTGADADDCPMKRSPRGIPTIQPRRGRSRRKCSGGVSLSLLEEKFFQPAFNQRLQGQER